MTNRMGRRGLAAGAALLPAGFVTAAHAQTANETTLARIQRSKTIRIAALSGQMPYFSKDISSGEWTGACVDMANSLAKVFDAKIEWVEATYGTSVLDLQTNKVDLGFALNPTPERALSIGFTHPMLIHPFGCVSKTLSPKTWDDLNKPNIRIAYDIGSLHETLAKRFCPNAQNMGFPNTDQAILALQTGRVDVVILAAMLGLSAIGKNPSIGKYYLLSSPNVALPSCLGIQEQYSGFATVINAWLDMNRGTGQLREWLIANLEKMGVKPDQFPPDLTF